MRQQLTYDTWSTETQRTGVPYAHTGSVNLQWLWGNEIRVSPCLHCCVPATNEPNPAHPDARRAGPALPASRTLAEDPVLDGLFSQSVSYLQQI